MRSIVATSLVAGVLTISGYALAQTASVKPPADPAVSEINRQRNTDPAAPAVPQQNRASDAADARGDEWADARQWLVEAQRAVQSGNLGVANELLERAETRLLTRTTLEALRTVPMQAARVTHISSAREAVLRRDGPEAMRQIDMALAAS